MRKKKNDKHPIDKIRKIMPPPTKVESNPKKEASKKACRKPIQGDNDA